MIARILQEADTPRLFPRLLKWIGRSPVERAAAASFPDLPDAVLNVEQSLQTDSAPHRPSRPSHRNLGGLTQKHRSFFAPGGIATH